MTRLEIKVFLVSVKSIFSFWRLGPLDVLETAPNLVKERFWCVYDVKWLIIS